MDWKYSDVSFQISGDDDEDYAEDEDYPYFKEEAGDVDADEDDIPLILDREDEEEVTTTSVPASTPGHLPSPPTTYLATTNMVPPRMKIPVSGATVNSPPIVWITGAAIIAQVNFYCGKIFRDTKY